MLSPVSRVVLATSFLSGTLAQTFDFSSLPKCAQAPILDTIGKSKCDPSRPQCLCGDDAVISDLVPLIAQACSGEDMMKAVAFGRALCPNLSTQSVVTITGEKTTMTINVDQMTAATSTLAAPTTPAETSAVAKSTSSAEPSNSASTEPTSSVVAGNGTNSTSPEQFHGDAPEFGPVRLWSMVVGILMIGMTFAEL
ncbi:cfem domain-containing protein [Diplodia corticola]|uniref:Cfem domain-containing protein n=1 Tax=Diplodia corticola TaxID=236234 RepID=A0A1J9RH29_9PEZI|nr:cfem domain-containing protein [Diplodia corticola]OJD39904.1 cfem domain-containing protein [Diplodia corticola]